ncbi:MAG: hypothetical protein AABY15_07070 [Nanoarchaeota archaeon]|mgnify:CR=1 FL=1
MGENLPEGKLVYLDFVSVTRTKAPTPMTTMAMKVAGALMSDYIIPIRPLTPLQIIEFEKDCLLEDIKHLASKIRKQHCL